MIFLLIGGDISNDPNSHKLSGKIFRVLRNQRHSEEDDMSTESMILVKEFHALISDTIVYAENVLYGTGISSNDYMGGNISEEDIFVLRTIHLSEKQKLSINKLLLAIGRLSVVGVLSVIDGVVISDKFDLPDLSLVKRDTKREIADEFFLNEEFYRYVDEA